MAYGNISAALSEEQQTAIDENVKQLWAAMPFLISLTDDEIRVLPKMGDKSVSFVEKSLDYAEGNAQFVPPYLSVPELRKDLELAKQLQPVFNAIAQLYHAMNSTYTAVGSEAMTASLTFYNSVRDASKRNIAGAPAIYDDLRKRFPGRGGNSSESSTPPTGQ